MDEAGCQELVEHLYNLLDGELSPEEADHLQGHLEKCSSCLERLGVELHFSLFLKSRCPDGSCPDLILERIRFSLASEITY
jgi:mycothiol system anti-sigma-R factor